MQPFSFKEMNDWTKNQFAPSFAAWDKGVKENEIKEDMTADQIGDIISESLLPFLKDIVVKIKEASIKPSSRP